MQTERAGVDEMRAVPDRSTTRGAHSSDTPEGEKTLYTTTKYAERLRPGEFDKVRAGLPLGGSTLYEDCQPRWDEVGSRTTALASLYTPTTTMAHEQVDVLGTDLKGALLCGTLPPRDQCCARAPADESRLLVEADEQKRRPYYSERERCVLVGVVGSLYGHPAAAGTRYDYLAGHLGLVGFEPLECEPCVPKRVVDGEVELVGLHVDDLLVGPKSGPRLRAEVTELRGRYFSGEGTVEDGPSTEYLGMLLEFGRASQYVEVSQEGYWSRPRVGESSSAGTPHSGSYVERLGAGGSSLGPSDRGGPATTKQLLPVVVSVLWGAQRPVPQLGVGCSLLAGEAKRAGEEDCSGAKRVLGCTARGRRGRAKPQVGGGAQTACSTDSSARTGPTVLGQAGTAVSTGDEGCGGPVEAESARSRGSRAGSTTCELDALHHVTSGPVLTRELLEEVGYPQGPTVVLEDTA